MASLILLAFPGIFLFLAVARSVCSDPAPAPAGRAGHGLAEGLSWVGRLYVLGGCVEVANTTSRWALLTSCLNVSDEVWSMLWEEHSGDISWWRQWPPAQSPIDADDAQDHVLQAQRNGATVISFYYPGSGSGVTTLFVWGGASRSGRSRCDAWMYDTERQHWWNVSTNSNVPCTAFHSTVQWKNVTIMFGGASATSNKGMAVFASTVVYNLMSNSWSIATPQGNVTPPARALHSASLLSGYPQRLFVHGGLDEHGQVLSDLWVGVWSESDFPHTISWKLLPAAGETPPPVFGHSFAEYLASTNLTVGWGFTGDMRVWNDGWTVELNNTEHVQWHRARWPTGLRARGFFSTAGSGAMRWLFGGASMLGANGSVLLNDVFVIGLIP